MISIFAVIIKNKFGGIETLNLIISLKRMLFDVLVKVVFKVLKEFGGFWEVENSFINLLQVIIYN